MACIEGRQKHGYQGGDTCVHCGESRPGAGKGNGAAYEEGSVTPGTESLADIKDELTGQPGAAQGSSAGQSAWQKQKMARSAKAKAEAQANAEERAIQGEAIARGSHSLQQFLAWYLYKYQGSAFELTASEVKQLGLCYARVLEAFGVIFDSRWALAMTLAFTEYAISRKQWTECMNETVEAAKAVNAQTEQDNRSDRGQGQWEESPVQSFVS